MNESVMTKTPHISIKKVKNRLKEITGSSDYDRGFSEALAWVLDQGRVKD